MKRFFWIFILLFSLVGASALDVQEVRWGFDGTVVPGRFNLLSVLVGNPSTAPFDGAINFYKSRGLEDRVGAMYGAPVYVSPLTTRWVQFYVYIDNQYDQWRLEWGRGSDNRRDIDPPKWSAPGQVLLTDSQTTANAVTAFRQFPDELFPTTVAATSGLDSLLLDHAPRWELTKRQAFLDWLRAGGKVHLLTGADGRYPNFSDELSILNTSQDRARIGAGLVVRHATTARQVRKQDVADNDIPLRQYKSGDNEDNQASETFLRALAELSHPSHNWALIYLLAFAYLGLVGPGNLVFGKRFADYRLRIALLIGTIVVFTGLFSFAGRRGQGESSVVHTLSYARAIDDDTYNVTQWINVFATHGAHYTITHAAPHNLYSTGQDYESVNGMIQSGKDGRFIVDVPIFSRRAVLHQAEMKGANLSVKIANWDGAAKLNKLTLTVPPDSAKKLIDGWVVQGDQVYVMKIVNGRLEFGNSAPLPLSMLLSAANNDPYMNSYQYGQQDPNVDVEGQFKKLAAPLINWSLSARDFTNAPPSVTSSRVDLFLLAPSPQNFNITGSQFSREIGFVLYHLDLFKPEL